MYGHSLNTVYILVLCTDPGAIYQTDPRAKIANFKRILSRGNFRPRKILFFSPAAKSGKDTCAQIQVSEAIKREGEEITGCERKGFLKSLPELLFITFAQSSRQYFSQFNENGLFSEEAKQFYFLYNCSHVFPEPHVSLF